MSYDSTVRVFLKKDDFLNCDFFYISSFLYTAPTICDTEAPNTFYVRFSDIIRALDLCMHKCN